MAEVTCVDGSVLGLVPVPVLDRGGQAYEVVLRLLRDGEPFGDVGERCGGVLAETASRLRAAQSDDGGHGFPALGVDAVLRAGLVETADGQRREARAALSRLLPRDRELLCLRARDPDDLASCTGELRLWLRDDHTWVSGRCGSRGRWSVRSRAVLDAWGSAGTGVRCVLEQGQLLALLDALVSESAASGGPGSALQPSGGPAEQDV